MSDPKISISIRLLPRNGGESTLHGYVFTDIEHARKWLTQRFVEPDAYMLEKVEVGELHRCKWCDGSGYRQSVKVIGKLTIADFLSERTSA